MNNIALDAARWNAFVLSALAVAYLAASLAGGAL